MPMVPPVGDKLPARFLADLIHAQMSTGNFGKMARDAIAEAKRRNDKDAALLYSNLQQQVADYFAQCGDDGTISITFRPE